MSGYPRPARTAAVALTDVAEAVAAPAPAGAATVRVSGVTLDSATAAPGDLYVGLPGSRHHGADFAGAAVAAGAVAVLTDAVGADLARAAGVDRPVLVVADPRAAAGPVASAVYGQPTSRLPVVGITGTAGKTSTAYLVDAALRAAGHTTALIGTVETRVADVVVDSVRTTPEATDLHALFAAALERGVSAAVMEVSSHALALGRVNGVHFEVGGWTNFGLDHLDFHVDVDDYFAAKAKLFDGRCRAEIINLDDPAVRRLMRPGRIGYSVTGDADAAWRATDITPDGFGQRFTVLGPDGVKVSGAVALPGAHNVANALLALASAVELGVEPDLAAAAIAGCRGVPGRMERVDAPGPVLGVVDYAHKPDAIVAVLAALRTALRTAGPGRVITVIGAGGDRDRSKRPYMGQAAARGSDLVVVTDDNPRTEDPAAVRAEVLGGAVTADSGRVVEVPGRRAAIAEAVRQADPGDVVAILGKGHELGQEIAGVSHPFDDRVELVAALTDRFGDATTHRAAP